MSKTKTFIGKKGLRNPTPNWVNWIFRTEFVLNKAVLYLLGSTSLLTPEQVKESIAWIATVDLVVWGFGRFIGEKKEDYEKI